MAHFAQLDENNIVTQVIVVDNNELLEADGSENPAKGARFCQSLLGGNWIQTSYNGKIRKNFAGIGYTYDAVLDAFIPPKPDTNSGYTYDVARNAFIAPKPDTGVWVLNEDTCQWEEVTDGN